GNRNPVSLTTDGTRVYWQELGMVTPPGEWRWVLRSVAKAGGTVTELATPPGATPGPLVSDGTSLWFEAATCPDPGCWSVDFAIWQTPVKGGPATRAASGSSQFAVQSGLLFSKSLSKDNSLLGTVDRTDFVRGTSSRIDTSSLLYNGLGYRVAGGLAADE